MESIKALPTRTRVTSMLRKAILNGEYQGGQELSLTELSELLGVSRTPIREAFQTLSAEGLIELRMNRGAVVKKIDRKFITDHFDMRILLECEAVRLAIKNKMDATELLTKANHLLKSLSSATLDDFIELNQEIHFSIWKCADNQRLSDFLETMWNGPSIGKNAVALEHHKKSLNEHIQLLQHIQNHDTKLAVADMKNHLLRSEKNILKGFEETI
jgi:DNA-binding GntR family transcriptional regulator